MPFHGLLHGLHLEVGQVAGFLLATPAHEVHISATIALARGDDEPAAATLAEQQTLEPVMVDTPARAATAMQGKDTLDALEDLRRHKRFVAAGVLLSVVFHDAQVVAVGQDFVELAQ
ncbi:hypothetical protein L6E12_03825 [Actinokineospora sp. PR83]|nr:hypothetical protein [Actinokineospora sp. PR83]MCG8914918.1 hypothetical protein [Actinokineospora sp. PR83]